MEMLSLILFLILLISFFIGLRRGFILQMIHLIGFFVSIFVAYTFYKDVSSYIRLWIPYPNFANEGIITMLLDTIPLETVYYNVIAFAMLFFATKIIMHIIGSMLNFVAHLPFLRTINGVLGGVLCFVEYYFLIFILLHIGALLPIEIVQTEIDNSFVANVMINHTPIISNMVNELFVNQV